MTGSPARRVAVLLATLALAAPLRAQIPVRAPGGTLTGVVRDSTTGRPVAYALVAVTGASQRVFASESGRFVLIGLGAGRLTLRVQQIGYRAVTLTLDVNTDAAAAGAATALEVQLAHRPVVLPEVIVQGDVCSGSDALGSDALGETIIDEALKNAERLLVLEQAYPFRQVFEETALQLDGDYKVITQRVDTTRYDTRTGLGYRRGQVLQGRRGREVANYFTTSDLAREEFQKWHCLWYAGRDTTNEGLPAHRIDFAPLERTKTPDWAGSLLVDSATMLLVRSKARLVNLRGRPTAITSAQCVVLYREIVPTLVVESSAGCSMSTSPARLPYTIRRWVLVMFGFVDKSPVSTSPP